MQAVARGIGLDKRIGGKFLHAGPGYGGSCFPKDTLALAKTAQDAGTPLAARRDGGGGQRPAQAGDGRARSCGPAAARSRGKTVALLGLTFKPERTTCATRRRWRSRRGCRMRGRACAPTTPMGSSRRAPLLRV